MISYTRSCEEVEKDFISHKIPTDAPGFYNHPNFTELEQRNPAFLNNYARFVQCRNYSAEYLADARRKIEAIVEILNKEIQADGTVGNCVNTSAVLALILERENIWSCQIKGSLTVNFPLFSHLPNKYFYTIISPVEYQAIAAHSWVLAPPFNVIDLTVKLQEYSSSESVKYLPDFVMADELKPAEVYVTEVCSPQGIKFYTSRGFSLDQLHFHAAPHLKDFFSIFPANKVRIEKTAFKYIPMAITAPLERLEEITNFKPNNKLVTEIYETIIKPAL